MYQSVLGASVTTTAAATVLPNTGSNMIVTVALSAAAGLATWGVLYVVANK
jgi:LPXTG-motif cell wall-anchored protein